MDENKKLMEQMKKLDIATQQLEIEKRLLQSQWERSVIEKEKLENELSVVKSNESEVDTILFY